MTINPLQQYFRQPKVFIGLPSHGVYNKPGTIQGDADHMPVFGMTGMDEIIMKTPDALLAGESTVKVIQSCCPSIKDAWDLSVIDLDLVLTAIRIATYGNAMEVTQTCSHCGELNDYSINLTEVIDHFQRVQYNNKVRIGDLTVSLRPITYKQSNDFGLKNFQLTQQFVQTDSIENDDERKQKVAELFKELAVLQNIIFSAGIESVEFGNTKVVEEHYIREWLENSENNVIDALKKHYDDNKKTWNFPPSIIKCDECGTENTVSIELDGSSFFGKA